MSRSTRAVSLRNTIVTLRKRMGLLDKASLFKGMDLDTGLERIAGNMERLWIDLKMKPGQIEKLKDTDLSDRYGLTIVDADAVLQRLKKGWRP